MELNNKALTQLERAKVNYGNFPLGILEIIGYNAFEMPSREPRIS